MEELDLKELCKMFWNKKVQILLIVLLFVIIGIVYSTCFVTPMYSSSTTLVLASTNSKSTLNNNSITTTDLSINSKLVSTYGELVKSKNVLRQVIYNLDFDIEEETLRKNVKVTEVKNTELIQITVTNEDKYHSAKIANEIAKVFMDKIKSIYNLENVQVVDKAETSDNPSNINLKKNILVFAAIGFVVSACYVFIDSIFDTTVKTSEEIENIAKVPVLASIPVYEETQKTKRGGK